MFEHKSYRDKFIMFQDDRFIGDGPGNRLLVGGLYDWTGSWNYPLFLLILAGTLMTWVGRNFYVLP
ncbi:MAG TPA: MFS transporter [Clostridia bacterium]|nr:MFS transporter [Clostridia bacterium]